MNLFSIEKIGLGKTYKKRSRSEITSIYLKKKITSRSLLRFLRKCTGGSLINARSLCPVDDANDQSLNATAWEFLLEEDLRVLAP